MKVWIRVVCVVVVWWHIVERVALDKRFITDGCIIPKPGVINEKAFGFLDFSARRATID